MSEWVPEALAGQRRAIARLLSLIEDDIPQAREIIAELYPHTGRAHLIGVTGSPGSGKSTLVAQLAAEYRRRGFTVGIIAVDPTSPFSGGAFLGDRIRMRALSGDAGVFIRSMASRGSLGGLARGTANVAKALDACGFQRILIETVGAGQSEVEIARAAHTTLVVEVPDMGDDIQTLKAGILEIADILVVNKADHDGAHRMVAALEAMLDLAAQASRPSGIPAWRPPICPTVAISGQGVTQTVDAIERHRVFWAETGQQGIQERARIAEELRLILRDDLLRSALTRLNQQDYDQIVDRVASRRLDPYTAVRELLRHIAP